MHLDFPLLWELSFFDEARMFLKPMCSVIAWDLLKGKIDLKYEDRNTNKNIK